MVFPLLSMLYLANMPYFESPGRRLYYETHGQGFPVLAFAPGGMRSGIERWQLSRIKPVELLARAFRVIVMDQRNTGCSTAPISAQDGWHSYTADHLALLDHLGVKRCHLLGVCIGGSFSLGLIQAAPERVARAVLIQPIGNSGNNRQDFYDLFDGWAAELPEEVRPDSEAQRQFRSNLYDGDFVYSVPREWVSSCPAPLLVLQGDDQYHPAAISRELVRLAPRATLIEAWKAAAAKVEAERQIAEFLASAVQGSQAVRSRGPHLG